MGMDRGLRPRNPSHTNPASLRSRAQRSQRATQAGILSMGAMMEKAASNVTRANLERDNYVHPGKRVSKSGVNIGFGQGMSLRDYFAGQVLAGDGIGDGMTLKEAAEFCYKMADAMLEEREQRDTSKNSR